MPFSMAHEIKIFSGSSNQTLAEKIVQYLGVRLSEVELERFADGEVNLRIGETVRGLDTFIIQSTSNPVNDNLMELLIMIDALKRASAKTIAVVIPYFGYARQDRKAKGRDPISAKLVANLLTVAGATRVVTIDLHAEQIQGFFDIPVDNLMGFPVFVNYFKNECTEFDPQDSVVVSPDVGGVKRARKLAEKLDLPLAILDKRRPKDNVAEIVNIIGDIEGKTAIIFDDIIDTGGSLVGAAEMLKRKGAKKIIACATHGVLSKNAKEKLQNSVIEKIYVTDTIYHNDLPDKFTVLSVASLLGETIARIKNNLSVSILFK
ncbi:ribose-phosphate pyrophosphokinase [Marinitoga litoralis]|jgi:ribose-phosphate pyrophosphokinase|uniref:ribose-phosphate pyrophosphokinase n=1 Tax=Marinitoga litoralis TaxID=570855 RepID=UPI001EF83EBA|nr:ribose-phosphate pyrophosphokinase [Marinitoga litoralis]MBM7558967.1 ribose-phosphate pyrophosphokinase [Marinitoga litoralis]